ncbi:MAG TPA: Vms1/Ankzf1 family peptidyl-tRNA hydrolase [Blastocatellia bacterium]|nr:Vms1/Ankzf1 family peptidyl-tRNA hydrolase [Blastocatellia bacterium]
MISYEDIRQLQVHPSGSDSLVLSLYVDVDQTKASNLNRGFETVVENLFRRIADGEARAGNGRVTRFETERQKALRFLRDYTPRGKGLVIFSDSTRNLWWQREVQVVVPTEARWSSQPWVRPLLALIERHDPLVIVLVDKHRARIIAVDASGMEHQSEVVSDVPGKHQTTGTDHIWSQSRMDRDHVNHIKGHARRVADALTAVVEKVKANRLVVGGPVEATSIFTDELPKRFQQMVIGTISVPVDVSSEKLLAELAQVQETAEVKDESRLVDSLITSARKRNHAVLGLVDTLGACYQGRIYRVIVESAYHAEGGQCTSCHALMPPGRNKCSFCESNLESAPDLINRLSRKVLDQGGKVQTVSGAAAEALADAGHIGAMLRF